MLYLLREPRAIVITAAMIWSAYGLVDLRSRLEHFVQNYQLMRKSLSHDVEMHRGLLLGHLTSIKKARPTDTEFQEEARTLSAKILSQPVPKDAKLRMTVGERLSELGEQVADLGEYTFDEKVDRDLIMEVARLRKFSEEAARRRASFTYETRSLEKYQSLIPYRWLLPELPPE